MQYAIMLSQNIFSQIDNCQQKQLFIIFFFLAIMVAIPYLFPFLFPKQNKIQRKKLILIGTSAKEKTKIFNIITENKFQRQSIKEDVGVFQEFQIGNNLDLVDFPFSIEIDDSKQKKEEIIQQLNLYFKQNVNIIQRLYLVVNFERSENINDKFYENIEYFKKFSNIINIIVTNFQLSEDQIQDKENLVKAFSFLVNDQKKIHFISDDIQIEELKQILIKSANLFDFKDTIFEDIDDIDDSEIENITKLFAYGKQYQSIQIKNDENDEP